jgi:hypothetical protein
MKSPHSLSWDYHKNLGDPMSENYSIEFIIE